MSVSLVQLDLSARDAEVSARFYAAVLDIALQPVVIDTHTVYRGTLDSGLMVVVAPDALTGVSATGSRLQLELQVPDVDDVVARALAAGGAVLEPVREQSRRRTASLRDPDGCSIVLYEG